MKTLRTKRQSKLMLRLRLYGGCIDEASQLENILARKPARLRIEMAGAGEIRADSALLIRSMLLRRSPRTRVTTNAWSNLRGASVLVWLLGDTRLIREDAKLYFLAAGPFEADANALSAWKGREWDDDDDLEKADYIRVLQLINEFLPVKELAGRPIELPVLKQFGLVDNERVDRFLTAAFRKGKREKRPKKEPPDATPAIEPKETGGTELK